MEFLTLRRSRWHEALVHESPSGESAPYATDSQAPVATEAGLPSAVMGYHIAQVRGVEVTKQKAAEIMKEILGAVGMGYAAQQVAIGQHKIVLPFLGAVTTIPLVYSLTYAIGRVMDKYFIAKSQKKKLSPEGIKRV